MLHLRRLQSYTVYSTSGKDECCVLSLSKKLGQDRTRRSSVRHCCVNLSTTKHKHMQTGGASTCMRTTVHMTHILLLRSKMPRVWLLTETHTWVVNQLSALCCSGADYRVELCNQPGWMCINLHASLGVCGTHILALKNMGNTHKPSQ